MKKTLALLLLFICCYTCLGEEPYARTVNCDTNGVGSATFLAVRGEIDVIYVSGVTTGDVAIAYTPAGGGMADIDIATNTIALTKTFRPMVKGTDVTGTDVTFYTTYRLAGEDVSVDVTNGASLAEWKVVLILK
jgi:hypothetical protein